MSQIRTPDNTDNWVMLGFESGEFPTVAIFTDDTTTDFRNTGTPLQRQIMALRLRYIADLLEEEN